MEYSKLDDFSRDDVERAIEHDRISDLIQMVISVSMYSEDMKWAESVCLRLANHDHSNLRGNAILGFGHIARVHGKLESRDAVSLVAIGLTDEDSYVRGKANSAADDIEHFLKIRVR